jgi:hypothetical protein
MDIHAPSDSKASDTDTRIDTKTPTADPPNVTGKPSALIPADSTNGPSEPSRSFALEAEAHGDDLDDVVTAVTTIAQSWCESATDYADIETLVCKLPIDQDTFAVHDALAPYSGPYPMALLVRALLVEKINGWDETALHDYLYAHPSLRRDLGFETLPNQSTFWRAWHYRFSDELRDTLLECAAAIVRAARRCDISLPSESQPTTRETNRSTIVLHTSSSPRQPTRCGSRPNRSSVMRLRSIAGRTGRFTRTPSGNSTPTWGCARTCMRRVAQARLSSIRPASEYRQDRPTATRSANSRSPTSARCSGIPLGC